MRDGVCSDGTLVVMAVAWVSARFCSSPRLPRPPPTPTLTFVSDLAARICPVCCRLFSLMATLSSAVTVQNALEASGAAAAAGAGVCRHGGARSHCMTHTFAGEAQEQVVVVPVRLHRHAGVRALARAFTGQAVRAETRAHATRTHARRCAQDTQEERKEGRLSEREFSL